MQERERNLNKNFLEVCDRFVDNKLSIHFGEDKTKCILSGTKHRLNKSVYLILNLVRYTLSNITQWHILFACWIKLFLDCHLLWKLSTKLIVALNFYMEKTGSCLRLFVDYFVTLYYSPILITLVQLGTLT